MNTIELRSARLRATIAPEAGGRIHGLDALVDGSWASLLVVAPDDRALDAEPLAYGSYLMAPWPGRVRNARFDWDGASHDLPANHHGHSIHGRGVWLPWSISDVSDARCTLTLDLDEQSGWPFSTRLTQRVTLEDDAIAQTVTIESTGDAAFPAGIGWHPWFRRDVGGSKSMRVRLPATRYYEAPDLIPTGPLLPVDATTDLRHGPPLDDRRLDTCYLLDPGDIAIEWDTLTLTMQSSPNVTHAVVYTPEHAFCVEPQTCANDAFNLTARGIDSGVAVVAPGSPLVASTRWRITTR